MGFSLLPVFRYGLGEKHHKISAKSFLREKPIESYLNEIHQIAIEMTDLHKKEGNKKQEKLSPHSPKMTQYHTAKTCHICLKDITSTKTVS